ncbi:MAG: response regulator [Cytophagaceae bacterium]|nr:response regulator [Cytophagaceae bacterium]
MDPKSILLIEDDELDIISVTRSINKINADIKLHTAFNGIEALEMLKGKSSAKLNPDPDLILLDINMPKMNGIEFLRELRKDEKYKSIKVFIMTTSNEDQDRAEAEALGISGYVIKPLNFNTNTKKNSSMDNFMHFQIMKILGQ